MGFAWDIQQLTEKLDYSQLRNSILTTECAQLRKALCEAGFMIGRSSSTKKSAISSLPTELLQHVFFYATDIGGLAFHSRDDDPYTIWKLSSRTRCAIPLVCRKWHAVGLKLLYEHIVIRGYPQITELQNHLRSLQASILQERFNWVHSLEFIMDSEDTVEASAFASMARLMVFTVPKRRLRGVSIDCAKCNGSKTVHVNSLVDDVLAHCHDHLEHLHISCLGSKVPGDVNNVISNGEGNGQPVEEALQALPRLQALSILGGYRGRCVVVQTIPQSNEGLVMHAFRAVVHRCIHIRTFSFNCDKLDFSTAPEFCSMLQAAIHLGEIRVVANSQTWMLHLGLDLVLESTHRLKRLLITPVTNGMVDYLPYDSGPDNVIHHRMAEIFLHMELWLSYQRTKAVRPLFEKMKSGHLPASGQVTIRGRYPEGCLDGDRIFQSEDFKSWENFIDWCAELGVELVNTQGDSIHLWRVRHEIRVETSDEDEEEWCEREESSASMTIASDTDSAVTPEADSDDGHVYQPDLEQISPDSDGEE